MTLLLPDLGQRRLDGRLAHLRAQRVVAHAEPGQAGLVDPLTGYSLRFDRDEHAAPLAPHVTARAAIDRDHPDLARARAAGILWAGIGPGRGMGPPPSLRQVVPWSRLARRCSAR